MGLLKVIGRRELNVSWNYYPSRDLMAYAYFRSAGSHSRIEEKVFDRFGEINGRIISGNIVTLSYSGFKCLIAPIELQYVEESERKGLLRGLRKLLDAEEISVDEIDAISFGQEGFKPPFNELTEFIQLQE